jgi:hypothetical protein
MFSDPLVRREAGQKYFDNPANIGAPFGDVYIPTDGLKVRLVNVKGGMKVQIVDTAAANATLVDLPATEPIPLDRARFKAGGTYGVRVSSAGEKTVPGAFEVVGADVAEKVEADLRRIDADPALDARSRPIARALVYEQEGLSFNREQALKELQP